jgi:eukaryotic-like serine/threonine-protein kinase
MSKVFTIAEGLENMGALKTGGQGSVFKARRTGHIITAVKLLPTPILSESDTDKNYRDFQNEVQKLKKVNENINPNVVKILGSGLTESGSFPFIEMEFIEGPDLEESIKEPNEPIFTIKETIKVAEHLSNAIAHCHRVDVKHGDIKSNNIKLNIHTGNYVLLDFGLAVMSDEQRRTSLRNAGAIEFMAPEQANGDMRFETDVYSFGVILFELLAGKVPFPLQDKTETARNLVLVAHMETPPPDMLSLRREHLPAVWPQDKKDHEMMVPKWLVDMIYKCLEKNPAKRFKNGIELHDYILRNSILAPLPADNSQQLATLQLENRRLHEENQQLHQQLREHQSTQTIRTTSFTQPVTPVRKKSGGWKTAALIIVLLAALLGAFFYFRNKNASSDVPTADTASLTHKFYKVTAPRAYFHDKPDRETRRKAYLIPSNDIITAMAEQNGFIYTEFTNSQGQTSKGWVLISDLEPLDGNDKKPKKTAPKILSADEIEAQLSQADNLLSQRNVRAALNIYDNLNKQEVPEAMYQFSNLALQGQNRAIDCEAAVRLMTRSADKGFTPAKRTLGFLHLFGDNPERLGELNYTRCNVAFNPEKGSELLMDAALEGDNAAQQYLDEYNATREGE